MEKRRWQANYGGTDWSDHYVLLGQHRDSEELDQSNFTVALEELGGESEYVTVARSGHWAVGWIEELLIREDAPEDILRKAEDIEAALADYPILSESHYSELQYNNYQECLFYELYRDEALVAKYLELARDSNTDCCSVDTIDWELIEQVKAEYDEDEDIAV